MGTLARRLLDRYVHMEAFALSQLLVKSVETRDWLQCAEPRSVRAVAKRVLEVSRRLATLSHVCTGRDRNRLACGSNVRGRRWRWNKR